MKIWKPLALKFLPIWKVGASPSNSFFNMLCTHYYLIIKKPANFQGLKILKQKHITYFKSSPLLNEGHPMPTSGMIIMLIMGVGHTLTTQFNGSKPSFHVSNYSIHCQWKSIFGGHLIIFMKILARNQGILHITLLWS